jgi:phasin family protein
MFKIEQFSAANEAAINQFAHFAQMSLANAEKFAGLSLDAARESVEQATKHAQTLAGARDVHEVIAINSAALEPAMKRAYTYSRTAYEAVAETNDEVKRVLEKQATDLNKAAIAALEEAFKYAPAGSETVVGNVKSAIAAAQSAYNNVAAINKQLFETVEKTVEQNVATVKAATKKSKRAK